MAGASAQAGEYGRVTIRPMREADVNACAALMLAIPLWAEYAMTAERARATFAGALRAPARGLVAEEDGRIKGFIVYSVAGTFDHSGYVRAVGVAPDAQGQGIGLRLMDSAEGEILRAGPNVFLLVSAWNVDARRFYERRGYHQIGEIPDYVRSGITEILYRKTLGPIERRE